MCIILYGTNRHQLTRAPGRIGTLHVLSVSAGRVRGEYETCREMSEADNVADDVYWWFTFHARVHHVLVCVNM